MSAIDLFTVRGKTAIVTGASYGLGVRMATTLAEAGANVVVAARSADKLKTTAAAVEAHGVRSLVQECDVSQPEQVRATVANAWNEFGRVDILVNNAGVIAETGFMPERIPDALFATTMATNVNGVFSFCREVGARQLADGKGGSIINIASVGGWNGERNFPTAYQASKAAVIMISKNLGASWAGRGVRVNALCPGWFASEMTSPFFALAPMMDRIKAQTPIGRHGAEHELDGALLFLASDASSYMTGGALLIDGGLSATGGGVDYSEDLFGALAALAGEYGTPIHPPS